MFKNVSSLTPPFSRPMLFLLPFIFIFYIVVVVDPATGDVGEESRPAGEQGSEGGEEQGGGHAIGLGGSPHGARVGRHPPGEGGRGEPIDLVARVATEPTPSTVFCGGPGVLRGPRCFRPELPAGDPIA